MLNFSQISLVFLIPNFFYVESIKITFLHIIKWETHIGENMIKKCKNASNESSQEPKAVSPPPKLL